MEAKALSPQVKSVTDTTVHSGDSRNCACWRFCTGIRTSELECSSLDCLKF